jgi:hypothetical protein
MTMQRVDTYCVNMKNEQDKIYQSIFVKFEISK